MSQVGLHEIGAAAVNAALAGCGVDLIHHDQKVARAFALLFGALEAVGLWIRPVQLWLKLKPNFSEATMSSSQSGATISGDDFKKGHSLQGLAIRPPKKDE
jgi:hypothetical protein